MILNNLKNSFLTLFCLFLFANAYGESNQKKTNICLTMIVKNESAIITRCLDSVKDTVDCICICDTGSTDNTVKIIEEYLEKNKIPGEICQHQWQNFGHNRSLSAEASQKMLKSMGYDLDKTYLMLLDADMMLFPHPKFDKNTLNDDSYLVMQKSSWSSWYNSRLLRASLPWKCVGVTHEYWAAEGSKDPKRFDDLVIDDRGDGGCKADKFERDVRLLTEGIKNEPNNERYLFYLGQSYHCLGNHDEAIKWYKARIAKGGWFEEVWFSKFMIGECYEEKKEWENALSYYLEAYNFNPARAEPLHKIASHYRIEGKNDLAYLFAKQGKQIPYPKNQYLFISHPVYEYQFDEEIAISAYYVGKKNEGMKSLNNLIFSKKVPQNIKDFAYRTALFYVKNLSGNRLQPIALELPKIREGFPETYYSMNPSIQKVDEGYKVLCRTVNYLQSGGKDHKSVDLFDQKIRTRNFFIHYDKEFNLKSQQEIVENVPRYRQVDNYVQGMEDCRLIQYDGDFWVTCSIFDLTPQMVPQIALCKLEKDSKNDKIEVTKLVHLKGPDENRCEKNWLPFVKDNEIAVIYSSSPLVVYQINRETGECKQIVSNDSNYDFSSFRGSAPPIEFDNGYLMIVHEVVFTNGQRYYLHRFVFLDENLNIVKVSDPFTFLHQGVEYTCGMTMDHTEKNLIIPLGIEDRNAYLCTIEIDNIRNMLHGLDE